MNTFHRLLRRIVPFLYKRNWYNGQFEFSRERAWWFAGIVLSVMLLSIVMWSMSQPFEYSQP